MSKIIIKFINKDGMEVVQNDWQPFTINLVRNNNFPIKTDIEMHLHTMVTMILGVSARRGVNFKALRGVKNPNGTSTAYVLLPTLTKKRICTARFSKEYKITPMSKTDIENIGGEMKELHRPKSNVALFNSRDPLAIIYMIHAIYKSEELDRHCTFDVISIAPMLRAIEVGIYKNPGAGNMAFHIYSLDVVGALFRGVDFEFGRYYSYDEVKSALHKAVVNYLEIL